VETTQRKTKSGIEQRDHSSDLEMNGKAHRSHTTIVIHRLLRSPQGIVGGVILFLLVLMALTAPLIAPHDPLEMSVVDQFKSPSSEHFFGTDEFGRDVFSRVIHGAQISLRVGLLATLIAVGGGTVLGLTSGYFGRWVDSAGQKIMDTLLAFPGLLLALAIIAVLGPGLRNVLIALGIGGMPYYARLVRGQVLAIKEREFIEAARVVGARHPRIMLRHILPNTISPLIVVGSLDLGWNILAAASLSFIGLGAQPPTPEWGFMLSAGRDFMRDQWWISTFPGIAIVLAVLSFNLLGDGLRDAFDPQSRD
jgi:peptide/nickel transport system permease protein